MKYFEKTSKEKSHKARNVAVGTAGIFAAALSNPDELIYGAPIRSLMQKTVAKDIKNIKSKKLMDYGLSKAKKEGFSTTVYKRRLPMLGTYSAGFISTSKDMPDVLLHEVGHGATYKKFKSLPKIRGIGKVIAPIASIGAAFGEKDSLISKAAPYIAGAAITPTLIDEGAASVKAIKDLKKAKATKAQLSIARKNLGKAFATYGIAAAGLTAIPMLIRKFKKTNKK